MYDYEHMKMSKFEAYSFTRLIRTQNFEFYFILGVNDPQDFDEYWDGRLIEVLGYLVTYIKNGQHNIFIYLIEDETKNFQEIIKHVKKFASEIYTYTGLLDTTNFIIQSTNVYQKSLGNHEIVDFIKKIVNEDIPEFILAEIKQ
ncbi:hypothetical protein [Lysinibacillus xylanilyticus]|uniref:hypothetical protein n=2 Tax=Lysinibacillus xylanilyticus TaxID=582475 RepID=UPI003824E7CB